jgi:hypothetical protein
MIDFLKLLFFIISGVVVGVVLTLALYFILSGRHE